MASAMEKGSLLAEEAQLPPPRAQRKRRFGIHVVIAAACLLALSWPRFQRDTCTSQLRSYDGESIEWERCGNAGKHDLECAEINVPMDQFDAANSGNKTFSIPLIRLRSENATKNLLINPGGPGAGGVGFIHTRGERLRTIVGDGFHLVSFDPRGVNMSRPLASCYPDNETRRRLSPVRDTKVVEDSKDLYAWTSGFVRACADTMGEHGKYINTPQTAADMNSILDVLGQEDMYYWGFSYGTLLGQTYASLFPARSRRVIIDGVVNHFDWYERLVEYTDMIDTDNVLEGFADECIKAGRNCSLSAFASNKDKLLATLRELGEGLKDEPVNVYVNNTVWGVVTHQTLWIDTIFPRLYRPALWYELADRIAKLLNGNATDLFLDYGLEEAFELPGDALFTVHLNDAKAGAKYWPQKRTDLVDMLLPAFNLSSFASELNKYHYAKQQWTIPRTHNFVPKMGVETAFPLLIMSTTFDPVCPLGAARVARESFVGSGLVELKGYGHCTLAMESACVAKQVRDYLYGDSPPAFNVECETDNNYFVPPEETAEFVEEMAEHESESERIRAAQLGLAMDIEMPSRWF